MNPRKQTRKVLRNVFGDDMAKSVAKSMDYKLFLYGAITYAGLRFLHDRGIFPDQTGAVLDVIDRTIDGVKQSIGITPHEHTERRVG